MFTAISDGDDLSPELIVLSNCTPTAIVVSNKLDVLSLTGSLKKVDTGLPLPEVYGSED